MKKMLDFYQILRYGNLVQCTYNHPVLSKSMFTFLWMRYALWYAIVMGQAWAQMLFMKSCVLMKTLCQGLRNRSDRPGKCHTKLSNSVNVCIILNLATF